MIKEISIGVDIGGTKIHFATIDRYGCIVSQQIVPTPTALGSAAIMECVLDGIGVMITSADELADSTQIMGIGIGSAGQINFRTGIVEDSVDTIPGWGGTQIKQQVQSKYSYPVFVDNDVNVIALAEKCYGAGLHYEYFVCLALGTGVGGAVVESGNIVRGAFGGAGELGHVSIDFNGPRCSCGNFGCLELYASGTGIARVAEEAIRQHGWNVSWQPTSRDVLNAWQQGDSCAAYIMGIVIRALSTAISGFIHMFNPQAVMIGGGVSEAGERFFTALRNETELRISKTMWHSVKLLPTVMGNQSGVIGAAAQVWNYE